MNNEKLLEAFSKVEVKPCTTCGAFVGADEYNRGEGSCFKCWNL